MTPLYVKTHNSLLTSLIKIDDLIEFAKKHDIKALTITDDKMYGVLEFYIKCIKENIKPIIGLEIFDIVLYAMSYKGYQNLIKLSTISSKDEINYDILKQYSLDVLCIVPYKVKEKYENLKFYKYLYQGYSNLDEKLTLKEKCVYCNEVLYLEEKDSEYLRYLYAIKNGVKAEDIEIKPNHNLLNYQLYSDDSNEEIVNLCNVEIPFNQDLLPVYDCEDSFTYLKQKVKSGLKDIFGETVKKVYLERLNYELDVINKMGFCNYFLVVADYVEFAKKNNILVGTGRGSAAGSLVSYCLKITSIDPIKYDLLFERFLNKERISMPDIDIDFEDRRREDVLKYCIDKYGEKKVAPIITFGTLASKQVIRDVGKSLDIPLKTIDYLAKMIDSRYSLLENYQTNNNLKQYLEENNLKKLYQISLKLEGLKRHTSIHAAGVVMAKENLDEVIPLEYHDNFYITAYSMEYLEQLGLLKMDLLALRNLTLIHNVLDCINISYDDIPLNDEKALAIFKNVDTIGIFQFESSGMMNFLRKFKPSSFDDVVAAIALFRPGPMQNIDSYIRRKNGEEPIDYITDSLKPILKPTYGIIIYQEQIMQIANVLANYSLAEADVLRKAMSKKKEDILLNERSKFISQSINNGYQEDIANKVYDLILKFASYGFNKAHSVSYAMIAYKMAYLKAHYYPVFMKNLLSMVIGSEVKTKEYIQACKGKITIQKPNINNSMADYVVNNNTIIYPLTAVKNVGNNAAMAIIEERNKGKFKDIFDFFARCYERSVNKKVIESLIKAGCFEQFCNQRTIDENIDILVNYSELGGLLEDSLKPELVIMEEYPKQEIMQREMEVFGNYLSNHPVSQYKNNFHLKDILKYFNQEVEFIVYIEKIKKIKTKKGETMLFITASDETDVQEFILFPKNYQEVELYQVYSIKGKVEKRFDKYQIIINQMKKVNYEE